MPSNPNTTPATLNITPTLDSALAALSDEEFSEFFRKLVEASEHYAGLDGDERTAFVESLATEP